MESIKEEKEKKEIIDFFEWFDLHETGMYEYSRGHLSPSMREQGNG